MKTILTSGIEKESSCDQCQIPKNVNNTPSYSRLFKANQFKHINVSPSCALKSKHNVTLLLPVVDIPIVASIAW